MSTQLESPPAIAVRDLVKRYPRAQTNAMVPPVQLYGHTVTVPTLDMRWVLLALSGTIILFFLLGTRTFHRRVVN